MLDPKDIRCTKAKIDTKTGVMACAAKPAARVALLLQGHPSRFWQCLADELAEQGAVVHKVNFCLADWLFWGRRPGHSYRGKLADWPEWLSTFVKRQDVTDLVYYADRFPYHVAARTVGERLGLNCWCIEFGYLRPDWLTLESGGMGAYSSFERTRSAITKRAKAGSEPDFEPRYPHSFRAEALNEVVFNLAAVVGRPAFPHYVADKVYWPPLDYLSWLPKIVLAPLNERRALRLQEALIASARPFNVVAMQIGSDYQIRDGSRYGTLETFLDEVMASFARAAPRERHLLVKLHPLDSGLERWFARARRISRVHGLSDRVHVIRGGDLGRLLSRSRGVVLVNSTVGLHALRAYVPVYACGEAIYDVPGLTHQGTLDSFWVEPQPVDRSFLPIFLAALATIQVKGSFFAPEGRIVAAREMAARLLSEPVGPSDALR